MTKKNLYPDKTDLLIGCLFAIFVMAIAFWGLTHVHDWGGDFAGYLLQAIAIDKGSLEKEVILNSSIMSECAIQIGPNAYPWGFPFLLWIASKIVGFNIYQLKIVEILSLGLAGFFVFHFARFYVSRSLSLAASSLVVLQPRIILLTDHLLSDIPFLSLCALTIYSIELFHRSVAIEEKASFGFAFLISVLCTISFSFRSNGAFLVPVYLTNSAWLFWKINHIRQKLLSCAILFICSFAVLVFFYFYLLPDGSLVHATYLTANPFSIFRRIKEIYFSFGEFIPFFVPHLPSNAYSLLFISLFFWLAVLIGAWTNRMFSSGLVAFIALNIILIIAYPYSGGGRYLIPLLLPISVLSISGVCEIIKIAKNKSSQFRYFNLRSLSFAAIFFSFILAVYTWRVSIYWEKPYERFGPYGPDMCEVINFVSDQIPENNKIAFYKPRVFRLLTGRPAIVVNNHNQIDRIQYLVFNKLIGDRKDQLSREYFNDIGRDAFVSIFENQGFTIYRKAVK